MALLCAAAFAAPAAAADVETIDGRTPWRVFLVLAPPVQGTADNRRLHPHHTRTPPTELPPAGWRQADFDDGTWGRYGGDLIELVGGHGYRQSPWAALLCLRTRFGVSDAAAVKDLRLRLAYRGGVVVYVNGREVARGHLPEGKLDALALAEDYPVEAQLMPDGKTSLSRAGREAEGLADRLDKRIRRLSVAVPPGVLRKGANVLAIELHRAAALHVDWSTVGLCEVALASKTGAGVVACAAAAKGVQLWNAGPLDTVTRKPDRRLPSWGTGPMADSPAGLTRGNCFDPPGAIRIAAARGGVCSGQVVVSSSGPLKGVTAKIGPLRHASGAALPASALEIRYAVQQEGARFCDALLCRPDDAADVQPVWLIVNVPRQQRPGWYTGELVVSAAGRAFRAPVQVLVCGWTLPEPKAYRSFVSLLHSPDTLALKYGVEPLSDRHFALMERVLELMGQVGNDLLFIPVVHNSHMGHRTGFVRWARRGDRAEPEFAALKRYVDLYARHCGAPKVICLKLWKPQYGSKALFRGAQVKDLEPVVVTELDPKTGKMSPMEAPMFGRAGSDAFWKRAIDGVRAVVAERGWDAGALMLGEGFDSRPLKETVDFFNRVAPGMRWVVFSHWERDPRPQDGRLIVSDGMEVGCREQASGAPVAELHRDWPDVPACRYVSAGSHRMEVVTWSSPTSWRNVPNMTGSICRLPLDFWPLPQAGGRSLLNSRICGAWLYRTNPLEVIAPGPEGPVPSVRFQMLREGVQETEARIFIAKSLPALPAEKQKPYRDLLAQRAAARRVGAVLTQAQISLDWLGLTAREYAAAAQLAGEESDGEWSAPPAPAQHAD